jgi:hypothetical protein
MSAQRMPMSVKQHDEKEQYTMIEDIAIYLAGILADHHCEGKGRWIA